jgi:hypothetical protein
MWEHRTFDNKIFGYGRVYYSNSIIITNFMQTLILNRWFENVFPTYFGIEISMLGGHGASSCWGWWRRPPDMEGSCEYTE